MRKSLLPSDAEMDIAFEHVQRDLVDRIRGTGLPIVVMKDGEMYPVDADELEKGLDERIARRLAAHPEPIAAE